jgi:hypothetical protein
LSAQFLDQEISDLRAHIPGIACCPTRRGWGFMRDLVNFKRAALRLVTPFLNWSSI